MAENEDVGRPTKCTPEVRDKIVAHLLAGESLPVAAERAGIDRSTPYEWIARGMKENDRPYKDFADHVHRAQAEVKTKKEQTEAAELAAAPDNSVGRPTECTPEVCQQIFNDLEKGTPLKVAAHFAGVGYSTVREWYARGERSSEQPYRGFFLGARKSTAAGIRRPIIYANKLMAEGNLNAVKFIYEMANSGRRSSRD